MMLRRTLSLAERANAGQRLSQACSHCNRTRWIDASDLIADGHDAGATLDELEPAVRCPSCGAHGAQRLLPADPALADVIDAGRILLIACRRCRSRRRMHPVRLARGHGPARAEPAAARARNTTKCPSLRCHASGRDLEVEIMDAQLALAIADHERSAGPGDEIELVRVDPPYASVSVALAAIGFDPHCRRLTADDPLYERLLGRTMDEEIQWPDKEERWMISWIGRATVSAP